MLKGRLDSDLKQAMLSGDKPLVEVLRMLKSAVLYKEVADGKRELGLSDEEVVVVLKKEQKTRRDAVALYEQAGETARVKDEQYQLDVIARYLPQGPTPEQMNDAITEAIKTTGLETVSQADFGRLMAAVKQALPSADGAEIAALIKERITQS